MFISGLCASRCFRSMHLVTASGYFLSIYLSLVICTIDFEWKFILYAVAHTLNHMAARTFYVYFHSLRAKDISFHSFIHSFVDYMTSFALLSAYILCVFTIQLHRPGWKRVYEMIICIRSHSLFSGTKLFSIRQWLVCWLYRIAATITRNPL